MIKKSKVTNVQNNGTWEGKFGLMYKFEIDFQNDDCGEYSSKSKDQNKFVIGEEVEYEFIDGKFPKVKPVYQKPDFASNGFSGGYKKDDTVQKMIVKQSSLKSAVDYCSGGNCSTSDVLKVAQEFVDWVMENKKPDENNEMIF
jgi:hypothetical protein|tara:strand:- start:423 stop:851 length:429 start_codon:yes stop_codon:yes gene_type:complete